MNRAIINNFIEVVKPDDELYILGDLVLGNIEEGKKLLARIPGRVHVILGNHDSPAKIAFYESLGWDCQWGLCIKIGGYIILMSHWPTRTSNFNLKPLKREVINLCGHSHTSDRFYHMDGNGICYHVELDAHNNYPVLFEDIIKELKEYEI